MGGRDGIREFCADLTGEDQVPLVYTRAQGFIWLGETHREKVLQAKLMVQEIRDVVQAHIHLGRPNENGPVVAPLFGPSDPVSFDENSLLACRTITRGDLVGPLQGRSLSRLIHAIRAGNAYVNVHTRRHPDGEIRGQLARCN